MLSCLETVPTGHLIGVLTVLLLLSILYAIGLQWAERKSAFVTNYTWLTVVVGVAYTLVGLALISWEAAMLAVACFTVSGVPIVGRSIINDNRSRNTLTETIDQRGNLDHD